MNRQHYSPEFKSNAIMASFGEKPIAEVAKGLGIQPNLLYRWRLGKVAKGSTEVSDLSAKLKATEIERDVLKEMVEKLYRK